MAKIVCHTATQKLRLKPLDKYIEQIREFTSRRPGRYIYRGHKDSKWLLRSTATRRLDLLGEKIDDAGFSYKYLEYHRELLRRARTSGFDMEGDRKISTLSLLGKLRHFGAATGLLDFTWSPIAALWFASEDTSCDGKLFVLAADNTVRTEWIAGEDDSYDLETIFSREDSSDQDLLLWEPLLTGDAMLRILRQRSVFIIGRPLIPCRQMISEGQMEEINISKEEKKLIREQLKILDITQSTLFSDIYGFCETEGISKALPARHISPEDCIIRARDHYRRREYEEAIEFYTRCIELKGDICETYFLRGNAKSELRRYKEAISDYSLAISNKDRPVFGLDYEKVPAPFEDKFLLSLVHYNRGNSWMCEGDYEKAAEDYTHAIDLSSGPEFSAAFFNRGNANFEMCDFTAAIKDYDKAVESGYTEAMFNKGNALVIQRKFQLAVDCYKKLRGEDIRQKGAGSERVTANLKESERLIGLVGEQSDVNNIEEFKQTRFVTITEQGHGGDGELFVFTGNTGNTGNMGGNKQHGGGGFGGGKSFSVKIKGRI